MIEYVAFAILLRDSPTSLKLSPAWSDPLSKTTDMSRPNCSMRIEQCAALDAGRAATSRADHRRARPQLGRRALILWRPLDVRTQNARGLPTPVRVVEDCAGERHHVGLALGNDSLGLLGADDQSDRARCDAGFAPYPFGQRNIVARRRRVSGVRSNSSRGHADVVEPDALQLPRKYDRIVDRDATLDPVTAGDPRAQRDASRHNRAHGLDHRQRKTHAVLQRPAISVGTLVG